MLELICPFFFLFQNLKNQIMTTNLWVEQVRTELFFRYFKCTFYGNVSWVFFKAAGSAAVKLKDFFSTRALQIEMLLSLCALGEKNHCATSMFSSPLFLEEKCIEFAWLQRDWLVEKRWCDKCGEKSLWAKIVRSLESLELSSTCIHMRVGNSVKWGKIGTPTKSQLLLDAFNILTFFC